MAHHRRSDQNTALRQTWWCICRATARNSNIRRINVFPGTTALLACPSFPSKDSNSFFKQDFRPTQEATSCCNSNNFAVGTKSLRLRSPARNLGPPAFSWWLEGPTGQDAEQGCEGVCTFPGGWGSHHQVVVETVDGKADPLLLSNLLHRICDSSKDFGVLTTAQMGGPCQHRGSFTRAYPSTTGPPGGWAHSGRHSSHPLWPWVSLLPLPPLPGLHHPP